MDPSTARLAGRHCLSKSFAGPGVYHLRMRSWQPTNSNQPHQEAGRIVVGRSNALRLLAYEHADLVVLCQPELPSWTSLMTLTHSPSCDTKPFRKRTFVLISPANQKQVPPVTHRILHSGLKMISLSRRTVNKWMKRQLSCHFKSIVSHLAYLLLLIATIPTM